MFSHSTGKESAGHTSKPFFGGHLMPAAVAEPNFFSQTSIDSGTVQRKCASCDDEKPAIGSRSGR